jgi:hypothetical protein
MEMGRELGGYFKGVCDKKIGRIDKSGHFLV